MKIVITAWYSRSMERGSFPSQLAEILSRVPQKSLLRRYLFPPGSLEERVTKLLYENRNTFWNNASYRRVFFNQCIGQFPEECEPV